MKAKRRAEAAAKIRGKLGWEEAEEWNTKNNVMINAVSVAMRARCVTPRPMGPGVLAMLQPITS